MKKKILLFAAIITLCSCNENKTSEVNQIDKIEIEESGSKVNSDSILNKFEISNVDLKCYGPNSRAASFYGAGVSIFFKIKNNSNFGIKTVYLKGTFKYEGRTFEFSDDINYEFRKGLEPGETEEIIAKPNVLSDWDEKIQPSDRGKLSLILTDVEDYEGKNINSN